MTFSKIIFITECLHFPPLGGGQIRDFFMLKLLSEHHPIEVLTFDSQQAEPLPKQISVEVVARDKPSLVKKILSPFRSYIMNGYSQNLAKAIQNKATVTTLLWASRLTMGKYIHLGKRLGLKILLDEHNVESDLLLKSAWKYLGFKPSSWLHLVTALQTRCLERHFCQLAHQVTATSTVDAQLLSQLSERLVYSLPNCIDSLGTSLLPTLKNPTPESSDFLFVGSLNYEPNVEGLHWFIQEVLPLLRNLLLPHSPKISLVGFHPHPSLIQLTKKNNLTLHANPIHIRPFLQSTQVLFVPLLSGSGTRIKILEGMSFGKAIISTTKGQEGLNLTHGQGIWIADSALEFAKGMKTLWNDLKLRKNLETQAKLISQENYDWRKMRPKIKILLQGFKNHL